MPKSQLLIATTTAFFFTALGIPSAFAQVACFGNSLIGTTLPTSYHGYSDKPAKEGAPGTSVAVVTTTTVTKPTADCTGSTTITTVRKHYLDGPGKSDYSKHDSIISTACEATGTGVCP